jgi:hypothetical protein
MMKPNSAVPPVVRPHVEKRSFAEEESNLCTMFPSFPVSTEVSLSQSIALSESVAVTVPKPNQLKLLRPLETTYKARYKSDYFPQTGVVRRPRYVADDKGNHCVTLQV